MKADLNLRFADRLIATQPITIKKKNGRIVPINVDIDLEVYDIIHNTAIARSIQNVADRVKMIAARNQNPLTRRTQKGACHSCDS